MSDTTCTCERYVVDYSDPERYHPENMDREDDPNCPVHRDPNAEHRTADLTPAQQEQIERGRRFGEMPFGHVPVVKLTGQEDK